MRSSFAIYTAVIVGISATNSVFAQQTTTFRNGENGYTGTVDRRIGAKAGNNASGSTVNTNSTTFYLDGGERGPTAAPSDVTDGLIRFDNIIGTNAIPSNALIISATLDLRTTTGGNSPSGGGFSVYGLSSPFDQTTTWATDPFGDDGTIGNTNIQGGYFSKPAAGAWTQARVDRIVQSWVNGGPNHGFAIRSNDTEDGWSFNTTGAATVTNRPGLTVNYTTDPKAQERRYQQSINGYSGTVDNFINGFNAGTRGVAVSGWFRETGAIDGSDGGTSYDQPYMVKFNNIDLSIPSITKAELSITTSLSGSADTGGPFTIHRILKPWDENTTYASLDSDNNPELNQVDELVANGFLAPASTSLGFVPIGGQVTFDVTDIAQAWKDGEANYGVYIGPGTSNAWAIFTSGAGDPMLTPELRLLSVPVSVPEPGALGVLAVGGLLMLRRRRRAQHS